MWAVHIFLSREAHLAWRTLLFEASRPTRREERDGRVRKSTRPREEALAGFLDRPGSSPGRLAPREWASTREATVKLVARRSGGQRRCNDCGSSADDSGGHRQRDDGCDTGACGAPLRRRHSVRPHTDQSGCNLERIGRHGVECRGVGGRHIGNHRCSWSGDHHEGLVMSALRAVEDPTATWEPVDEGEDGVAVAERPALGTVARVAAWPPEVLATGLVAVDRELEALDLQASRFRSDSEISRLHRSRGDMFLVSDGLAQVIAAALAAAQWTNGLVDPTVGAAIVSLGYDCDFVAVDSNGDPSDHPRLPAPGWSCVRLDGRILRLPVGVLLDLGATAKGLGSDRAAAAAFVHGGRTGGILVSLGGDIAVAGRPPGGGWPVRVAEDPIAHGSQTQVVRLTAGALATSSVGCRRWRRGDQELHHIIDPRTGSPSTGSWRTASVAAPTCAMANAASTALIVGGEDVDQWFSEIGLPARLIGHDGSVRLVGSWPKGEDAALKIPPVDCTGSLMRPLRITP